MGLAMEKIEAAAPEPEDGAPEDEKSPLRRCLVTGDVRPKAELLRFVVSPDGVVVPDVAERLPGRGLWLTPSRDIVTTASGKGLFAKAARTSAAAPAELADQVEALLARRCCDLLGFARRAGQAAAGFEKVRAWLEQGKAGLIFAASDGAEDGRRKIQGLAPDVPVVALLTAEELGRAVGRQYAVHVAVKPGKLAEMLRREAGRLAGFRAPAGREQGKSKPKKLSRG